MFTHLGRSIARERKEEDHTYMMRNMIFRKKIGMAAFKRRSASTDIARYTQQVDADLTIIAR
jgi:hypothetical protein